MKSISSETKNLILSKLEGGISVKGVAKYCGVSVGTVSKYKNMHLPNLLLHINYYICATLST